jgi:hypothetical protein
MEKNTIEEKSDSSRRGFIKAAGATAAGFM